MTALDHSIPVAARQRHADARGARMPRRRLQQRRIALAAALAALMLVGCGRAPSAAVVPMPAIDNGNGRMAWAGILPCADCDGIQTRLQLQRSGEQRAYRLVEVYVLGDRGARFNDTGRWSRDGNLVRTVGADGSPRAWALLPGGGLQPRDAAGDEFAMQGGAALAPVAAERAR